MTEILGLTNTKITVGNADNETLNMNNTSYIGFEGMAAKGLIICGKI